MDPADKSGVHSHGTPELPSFQLRAKYGKCGAHEPRLDGPAELERAAGDAGRLGRTAGLGNVSPDGFGGGLLFDLGAQFLGYVVPRLTVHQLQLLQQLGHVAERAASCQRSWLRSARLTLPQLLIAVSLSLPFSKM